MNKDTRIIPESDIRQDDTDIKVQCVRCKKVSDYKDKDMVTFNKGYFYHCRKCLEAAMVEADDRFRIIPENKLVQPVPESKVKKGTAVIVNVCKLKSKWVRCDFLIPSAITKGLGLAMCILHDEYPEDTCCYQGKSEVTIKGVDNE